MRVLRWAARLWIGVLSLTVLLAGLLLVLRLLLPLPFLSPRPVLLQATPGAGATGVLPRARMTLRFNVAMNPRSVERALRVEPPMPAKLIWDDDNTTLTISPTRTLRPEATYQVMLDAGALSRMFRATEGRVALSFHTAPAPAVLAVLPPEGARDVPPETPISVRFSRMIVPTTTLALLTTLPELRFDPPLEGSATWLDQTTVLFRPTAPLRPGARYRATLAADLTDLGGGELGNSFSWSFSTPPPKRLAVEPAAGDRWVAPRAPLILKLSQPLDLATIQASLAITPTNSGTLTAATLPDATQWITFTPSTDWLPDTTYTAALRGVTPSGGNPAAQEPARWSFTTAPRPAVIGRFPGEGQTLPPGQDIRLIFNTPMDGAALRQTIRITPPADAIRVTAGDVEARIAADLRPATVYTMTLPAALADRNGVPLGREYQIRFVTAPASPALELPDAPAHIAHVPPGRATSLSIRRTNLSALNLDLYGLDDATTVRALAFGESDWSNFQPERYARPLLRSWVVPLTDTLNTVVADRLPLSLAAGQPLPPGVYYLRIRTPEGPRADLLVLVSHARLALQTSDSGILIWATDAISATPIGGLPVVLYQDGALIRRGATDANGLWQIARSGGDQSPLYVALAGGDRPGIASSAWSDGAGAGPSDGYRAWLTTDRAAYRPGERVALVGFVRRAAGQSNALPPPGLTALLTARQLGASGPLYRQTVQITGGGFLSAGFDLPADAPPDDYILAAAIGGAVFHTTFAVQAEAVRQLEVTVSAPERLVAGDDARLAIAVSTPEELPVAGATISWTLNAEPLPFPARGDYTFGDDEPAPDRPDARSGLGLTDADGRLDIVISDTVAANLPLRYRLVVWATEPGGPSAESEVAFLVAPARVYVGVRLPSRVLRAGQRGAVEALAVTPEGQPAPRAAVNITVYRRTWIRAAASDTAGEHQAVLQPRDQRVFAQSILTGVDGRISLPLTLNEGGEYRVLVSAADAGGRRTASATSLWVAAPGFTGWRAEPDGRALLIADRRLYQPGETATLLLATPHADATALVTVARDGGITGEVRMIRAGEPLTITITLEDAPSARVAILLASRATSGSARPAPSLTLATTTLPVLAADRAISVTIASDRATYAPRATAILTITTTDAQGMGVPAAIVLSLVGAETAPRHDLAETFRAAAPPPIATARMPGAPGAPVPPPAPLPPPPVARPPAPLPAAGVYWNPALHTGASGVLTVTVQLPQEPAELHALAWAASAADHFGQAEAALAVTRPLALRAGAPPFFRVGDEVVLSTLVQNTSAISQEASVSLTAAGLEVRGTPLVQRVTITPGATARVAWPALVGETTRVAVSFSLQSPNSAPQTAKIERPALPAPAPARVEGGVGLLREYLDPQTGQLLDSSNLRAGQLVRVRLTTVVTEARRFVTIDELLPAGCVFVDSGAGQGFERIGNDADHLTLVGETLPPGIYEYRYLLRAVAPGRYAAPAPVAHAVGSRASVGGPVVGVGNAATLVIAAP